MDLYLTSAGMMALIAIAGAYDEYTAWTHKDCGGRIIGVDPDGMGNLYHCSKCGSDKV